MVGILVKNLPAKARDTRDAGLIPVSGNMLQDSCLENFLDRGAWWAKVHGIARSQT